MAYIIFNSGGGVQKHLVTNTCNKPRIAVKDGNTTSYIPMKTTTVTVSTSVQITSTTGTTYNTLQKTTSAGGGGNITGSMVGIAGPFVHTQSSTIRYNNHAPVDASSSYSNSSWVYQYGQGCVIDSCGTRGAIIPPRHSEMWTYSYRSIVTVLIGGSLHTETRRNPYGPNAITLGTDYRTYTGTEFLTIINSYRTDLSSQLIGVFNIDGGGSNNIYYTVTTGASFGTRTSTISKELTVVTYV